MLSSVRELLVCYEGTYERFTISNRVFFWVKKVLNGVENQSQLVIPQTHPTLGPVEITGLEDSTLNKVVKLSPEQRKERINRYMKKRNERNFSKKIKVQFLLNQTLILIWLLLLQLFLFFVIVCV